MDHTLTQLYYDIIFLRSEGISRDSDVTIFLTLNQIVALTRIFSRNTPRNTLCEVSQKSTRGILRYYGISTSRLCFMGELSWSLCKQICSFLDVSGKCLPLILFECISFSMIRVHVIPRTKESKKKKSRCTEENSRAKDSPSISSRVAKYGKFTKAAWVRDKRKSQSTILSKTVMTKLQYLLNFKRILDNFISFQRSWNSGIVKNTNQLQL